MARTSAIAVADQILDGKVSTRIRELRDGGATHDAIAAALAGEFGLTVDRVTVLRWFQRESS